MRYDFSLSNRTVTIDRRIVKRPVGKIPKFHVASPARECKLGRSGLDVLTEWSNKKSINSYDSVTIF